MKTRISTPIEARMLCVLRSMQSKYKSFVDQRSSGCSTLRARVDLLNNFYTTMRAEIAGKLGVRDQYVRWALDIKEVDGFYPEHFVFDTDAGVFQNSNPDIVALECEMANVSDGNRFLDVGTGMGEVAFTAALFGASVVTVEINPYFFNMAIILKDIFSVLPGISDVGMRLGDYRQINLEGYDFYHPFLPPELIQDAYALITRNAAKGAVMFLPSSSGVRPQRDVWVSVSKHLGYVKT